MTKHVTEWLGPYHDGELHGARLRQVEQRLSECTECKNELEEMKELSAFLHESPAAHFLPTDVLWPTSTSDYLASPNGRDPAEYLKSAGG